MLGARFTSWSPALLRGGILVGATLLLVVALQDIEWDRMLQLVRGLRLPWVAVAIGLPGSIIFLWSLQRRVLVPVDTAVTWANMFLVVSAIAMISNSVLFMVGQASGVLLIWAHRPYLGALRLYDGAGGRRDRQDRGRIGARCDVRRPHVSFFDTLWPFRGRRVPLAE